VCFQAEVSATGWSLVQRSPTECGVSKSVIVKPRKMRRPRPPRGCRAIKKMGRRWGMKQKNDSLISVNYKYLIARWLELNLITFKNSVNTSYCILTKDQPVNRVLGNLCLFWESHTTQKYTAWKKKAMCPYKVLDLSMPSIANITYRLRYMNKYDVNDCGALGEP
jgi:hypothetical protein